MNIKKYREKCIQVPKLLLWRTLVLIFANAASLSAQPSIDTIAVDTIKKLNINEVRVTGKTGIRKVKEQAFNVNVIDANQFYNSSADINQTLNRSTGIRIREDGGLGSSFNFSLNGFSGKQIKFFMDGLPMDNFGSSLTLNNFPATMAERIEIYKGVLPVNLGADALGGAVNIITRTHANYLDISYGYGSFNTHKTGINGSFTNAKTGFTFRTNAFYNYSDNNYKVTVKPIDFSTGLAGPEQKIERFHDGYQSIGAQVELGVTGRDFADHLLIGAIVAGNNRDIQTGVTMEQVFGARTSRSNTIIPTLKYKKSDLFTDNLDLTVYSAYNLTTNHFIDTTRLRFNWLKETIPTTAAELYRTQLENKDKEGLVSANLAYGINDNYALSLNYVLMDFTRKSSDVEDRSNVTFLLPQGLRKQTLGLAWQTTYNRFTATLFSKLYRLHAKSYENISSNNVPDYQPTQIDKTNIGYGVATAYFITPKLQAKASYEHTYRMPESTELLGDGLYIRRNSKLQPEKSDNINIGGLYTILSEGVHHLNFEGNFIYRNAKDYIRQDQQQVQPVDRQYINVGHVNTTGGEAEIRYDLNNKLFASVNTTFQHIIDRTEFLISENFSGTILTPNLNYGYRLPNMPYLFGNASIGTRFQPSNINSNTLSFHYHMSYVAKYYLTPNHIGRDNKDIIPKQISHDIFADYAIGNGKYNIAVEFKNLANTKLYDNYLLQKPGRSFFIKLRYFIRK